MTAWSRCGFGPVRPDDLFRPCVDPEVTDDRCELDTTGRVATVRNIPDYRAYYRNQYFKSFFGDGKAPWTGLGYTWLHLRLGQPGLRDRGQ